MQASTFELADVNAYRDVASLVLAVRYVGVGSDFQLAVDCGVFVNLKRHGLWPSGLVRELLRLICGTAGRYVEGEGRLVNGSDLPRYGLRSCWILPLLH